MLKYKYKLVHESVSSYMQMLNLPTAYLALLSVFSVHYSPYSKPTACLPRHGAPVFSVKVESANNRIYSIGNDNTIMVMQSL